jgi:hypothetical protein
MGYPFGREVGTKGTATVSGGCSVGGGNGTATMGGCVAGGVVTTGAGGTVTAVRTGARVAGARLCTTEGLVVDVVTDTVVGAAVEPVVTAGSFFAGVVTRLRVAVAWRPCGCEIRVLLAGESFELFDDERVRIATKISSAIRHITPPANACGVCPRRRSSSCS